jgi:hypothetical protein
VTKRKYPPVYEKVLPILLVALGLLMLVLLVVAVMVLVTS